MKIILWTVVAIIILFVIVSAVLGLKMMDFIMLARRKTYEIIKGQDAAYLQGFNDYETVWERHPFLLPVEGAEISGEYIVNANPEAEGKKVAIICHGHTVLRASDLKYAWMFYKLGYHIVIFDQRYFGASTGKYSTLGMNESRDIAAIERYAKEIFGDDIFIALHGESMGAASELLSLKYETPDLVIADCPFANSERQLRRVAKMRLSILGRPAMLFGRIIGIMRAGYDYKKVNPIEAVRDCNVPICFIHGTADDYIPCEHSKDMFSLCKNPLSEIHLVPGAAHALSVGVDFEGYDKILHDFVRKVEKESAKI